MLQDLEKYRDKIRNLYKLYFYNRELFIQAEESFIDMNTFVAPLIEHRDAFDHIMRCFKKLDQEEETFLLELEQAFAHELRAYYDVADYICICIRDYISSVLNRMQPREIRQIWVEYDRKKQEIYDISLKIAAVRNNRRSSLESIEKYRNEVMPTLFNIYEDFVKNFETYIRGHIKK